MLVHSILFMVNGNNCHELSAINHEPLTINNEYSKITLGG